MSKAETVQKGKLGKKDLRLVRKDGRFFGLADGKLCVEGEKADDVWRQLHDDAGKGDPRYFGFDGARARFLHFFPNGFQSTDYPDHERNYKLAAKAKLDAAAPLEKAIDGTGLGEAVLAAFRATKMLSSFEQMRIQDVLRGPHADDFVRGAARFAQQGGQANLLEMERALKPYDNAKWTVVTYLPYLWRPDMHMFLKPEATKDLRPGSVTAFRKSTSRAYGFLCTRACSIWSTRLRARSRISGPGTGSIFRASFGL